MHARGLPDVRRVLALGATAAALSAVALGTVAPGACTDIPTDPASVAAISLDSIPFPAVVAGDSLRDSLGVARPLQATVYNPKGDVLTTTPIRYFAPGGGVVVDSTTGFVVGDTARSTPVRLIAQAGGVQTGPVSLYVVPRPDTMFTSTPVDSFPYSLRDSTRDVSPALSVSVQHNAAGTLTPVAGWLVSYDIVYPRDTTIAMLVNASGNTRERVDTTGTDGTTAGHVRIRPTRLTNPTDTVVVVATARYRGQVLRGGPVRFRLTLSPSLH